MPEIGQDISHYSIEGKIGKGGMREVFQAKDQKFNPLCIIHAGWNCTVSRREASPP